MAFGKVVGIFNHESSEKQPKKLEIEARRVHCLLDETKLNKPFNKGHWDGYHPNVYTKCSKELADKLVSELCSILQNKDVTKYFLEMQIWWRDHQEADKTRIQKELSRSMDEEARQVALGKLTEYE